MGHYCTGGYRPIRFTAIFLSFPVTSLLRRGLLDRDGSYVGITRGYLTSDKELAGAVKMDTFYLALSAGIRPLNSSKLFRKWMESHFGRNVVEVGVALYVLYP